MKKQISKNISIILTLCMIMSMLPVLPGLIASAEPGGSASLKVGDNTAVLSGDHVFIENKCTWTKATNKLTLNGYEGGSIEATDMGEDFKIELADNSTNKITGDIYVKKSHDSITEAQSLTITGTGILKITTTTSADNPYAISVENDITIESGNIDITVNNKSEGDRDIKSLGIYARKNININAPVTCSIMIAGNNIEDKSQAISAGTNISYNDISINRYCDQFASAYLSGGKIWYTFPNKYNSNIYANAENNITAFFQLSPEASLDIEVKIIKQISMTDYSAPVTSEGYKTPGSLKVNLADGDSMKGTGALLRDSAGSFYRVIIESPFTNIAKSYKVVDENEVLVTFDAGFGGGTMTDQVVTKGTATTLRPNSFTAPTGNTFDGWKDDKENTYKDEVTLSADTKLTAQWKKDSTPTPSPVVPIKYAVKYNANGATGTVPTTQMFAKDKGVTIAEPGNLVKIGYEFVCWNTKADGTGTDYNARATYSENANLTLYAKWEKEVEKFTITANVEEGGMISPAGDVIVKSGQEQKFIIEPNEGMMIDEVKVDGEKAKVINGEYIFTKVEANHTITATFKAILSPGGAGWKQYDNGWKYLTDKNNETSFVKGWQSDISGWSGYKFYFDETTGYMQTGWQQIDSKYYYFDPGSGIMRTGWVNDRTAENPLYYYCDPVTGEMQRGWQQIDSKCYYFDPISGIMRTRWINDGTAENPRYFYCNPEMKTGWQQIDSKCYYFDPISGIMRTGWVNDRTAENPRYFYCGSDGSMQTGWLKQGDFYYYLLSNGVMATGWISNVPGWGNAYFYFYRNGAMAVNTTTPDGFTVDQNGAWYA